LFFLAAAVLFVLGATQGSAHAGGIVYEHVADGHRSTLEVENGIAYADDLLFFSLALEDAGTTENISFSRVGVRMFAPDGTERLNMTLAEDTFFVGAAYFAAAIAEPGTYRFELSFAVPGEETGERIVAGSFSVPVVPATQTGPFGISGVAYAVLFLAASVFMMAVYKAKRGPAPGKRAAT
jgi:hypothetical protein